MAVTEEQLSKGQISSIHKSQKKKILKRHICKSDLLRRPCDGWRRRRECTAGECPRRWGWSQAAGHSWTSDMSTEAATSHEPSTLSTAPWRSECRCGAGRHLSQTPTVPRQHCSSLNKSVLSFLHMLTTCTSNCQLPTTLLCAVQQSIDISCQPSPEQQTCSTGFAAVGPCWESQTHRPCTAQYPASSETVKSFLSHMGPQADLHFCSLQPDTSSSSETADMALVHSIQITGYLQI